VLNESIQWEEDGTASTMMIAKDYVNDQVIHKHGLANDTFSSALDTPLSKNTFVRRFGANLVS
jgi:hypothetical protein